MFEGDLLELNEVIIHGNCPDGMAAAMIIHDVLPNVSIRFLNHRTAEYDNLEAKPNMLFCDIIPPEKRIDEFIENDAVILDHHKGAENLIKKFKRHVFADEIKRPGISGANLAFEEVWRPLKKRAKTNIKDVIRLQFLAGIRDTWQNKSAYWEESRCQSEILMFHQPEYWLNDHLAYLTPDEVKLGDALVRRHDFIVDKIAKNACHISDEITLVPVAGGMLSDVSEKLREFDVVVGFSYYKQDNNLYLSYSLRSKGKTDVSKMAQRHGGNGHTKSAQFSVETDLNDANPYVIFKGLFDL